MARGKFGAGQFAAIAIFIAIGLFLFSNFASTQRCSANDVVEELHGCTAECASETPIDDCVSGSTYIGVRIPTDVAGMSLTMMKITIVGLLVFVGYALVAKWRGIGMGRRDVMALILLGVAAYFIWPYLADVMGAADFDSMGFAVGQKLGFFG